MTLQEEIAEIQSNYSLWCLCGNSECQEYQNFEQATQAILQAIESRLLKDLVRLPVQNLGERGVTVSLKDVVEAITNHTKKELGVEE